METETPKILGPNGQPARRTASDRCPRCGAGKEKRVASSGFGGEPHPICAACGYEWKDEVWGG